MPLDLDELERELDEKERDRRERERPLDDKIMELLNGRPRHPLTISELVDELRGPRFSDRAKTTGQFVFGLALDAGDAVLRARNGQPTLEAECLDALRRLRAAQYVESIKRDGVTYWGLAEEIGAVKGRLR